MRTLRSVQSSKTHLASSVREIVAKVGLKDVQGLVATVMCLVVSASWWLFFLIFLSVV